MVTTTEEQQTKDFLKRAEIRTMKKDLRALREADALTEKDKIIKLKTLEEQLDEKKKSDALAAAEALAEKKEREEVLEKNEDKEKIAEKDLKSYATEQERKQIFLLESQRLGFEREVDAIDKEKDPALKLQKNNLLVQKRDADARMASVLGDQKKLEDEMKFITDKERTTTISQQRKALEQSRWDLDKRIQDVEKRRWGVEKEINDIAVKIKKTDDSLEQLVTDKNILRDKILGADKSLREIYSGVMAREEEKRRGEAEEQRTRREAMERLRAAENEKVQRQQWTQKPEQKLPQKTNRAFLEAVPVPAKRKVAESFKEEDEQRKKFIQDVEQASTRSQGQPQQKSNIQ